MQLVRNLNDLARATMSRIQACLSAVPEGDLDAQHNWYDNDGETVRLRGLISVYYGALNNPPDNVIGVGAITYAEMKLVEAQREG